MSKIVEHGEAVSSAAPERRAWHGNAANCRVPSPLCYAASWKGGL
ncbi:hypothetical protein PT2222_280073 [Paraburkholderia tropica]